MDKNRFSPRVRTSVLLALISALAIALGVRLLAASILAKDMTTGVTANDIVNTLVGSGITGIANITYRGDARAAGTYTETIANNAIGLGPSGVVLSTGKMSDVAGSNNTGGKTTILGSSTSGACENKALPGTFTRGLQGDPALSAIAKFPTCDATVLEFDFVPDKDRVFLQYVFGSEEYNEFVNGQFNDVFAFWVNGVNCATVDPAHTIAVSINTINRGGPTLGTPPISNPGLFINNDFRTGAPRETQMDGLTVALTCQAAVVPFVTNHIKLAIADASDPNLDSNVFLRAGSFTTNPPLAITKKTNGTDNDLAPGPYILVKPGFPAPPVSWTYDVKNNTLADTLTGVMVTDNKGVAVSCPKSTLAAGESMQCTASGLAVEGQYENIGTVEGTSAIFGPLTNSNADHYFGARPEIKIITKTNNTNNDVAPGPTILIDTPVVWTYELTNTGNVPLTNLIVTDSIGVTVVCPATVLAVGASVTCSASGIALAGPYENLGSVIATPPGGLADIMASNIDHYFGADPRMTLAKTTNGINNDTKPGIAVLVGDPVEWRYAVTNTGNVPLTDVVITDDKLGAICTVATLAVGATTTPCTREGTAERGQYENLGTATANFNDFAINATNLDHYFGADPQVSVVKKTGATAASATDNGATNGPVILVGDQVVWTFTVTNTGNVPLIDVKVVDDKVTVGADCTIGPLDPGASRTCAVVGAAARDLHTNTATASGKAEVVTVTGPKTVVRTATDDDSYFGADPSIGLVKKTGTTLANATDNGGSGGPVILVGDPVVWVYTVTNTGNVPLTEVAVTDDKIMLGPDCVIGALEPGASRTCVASATATRGDYRNTGSASGKANVVTVTGPVALTRTDTDDDSYFGADPRLALVKKTGTCAALDLPCVLKEENATDNSAARPLIVWFGHQFHVIWTYTVTNTGNVPLTGVAITDDKVRLGPACTIGSLPVGASRTCSATGNTQLGLYTNLGTASGTADIVTIDGPRSVVRTATDDDAYIGAQPSVSLKKQTNGTDNDSAPGRTFLFGTPVTWSYIVTNSGNVPLNDLVVTDNKGVAVTCPATSLAPAASITCTGTGTIVAGHYDNVGTVVGTPPAGIPSVTASDREYYFGARPGIWIVKRTNGTNNNAAPGLFVVPGTAVTWTYEITNIGNVPLTDVAVTDSTGIAVSCPALPAAHVDPSVDPHVDPHTDPHAAPPLHPVSPVSELPAGATIVCSATGTAVIGQYQNTGIVTATAPVGPPLAASDDEFYFGVHPAVSIVTQTNGINYSAAPGATIAEGDLVTWTYIVTNTGNVRLSNISISDNRLGLICTMPPLLPGASDSCIKTGRAVPGQYQNVGSVIAYSPLGTSVTASDADFYFTTHVGPSTTTASVASIPSVPPPTGLVAFVGSGYAGLQWRTAGHDATYIVKRSTSRGGPYTVIAQPSANFLIDYGVRHGTTYYYVVATVRGGVTSADSAIVSATP